MRCQGKECENPSEFVQLTIDGEEYLCGDCMASLGGTYRDIPRHDPDAEPLRSQVS